MTIRIDPRWPLVWRDPFTIQLGIDPPRVVISDVGQTEERLLAALAVGITRAGLDVIAERDGHVVDAFLEAIAPALMAPTPGRTGASVALSGDGRFADECGRLLGEAGIRVVRAHSPALLTETAPQLAVIVGHGVFPPETHAIWLRRDVSHLPVLFTDSAVQVGPTVEPGRSACLVCIELHRRDADPSWPAIATQLLGRAIRPDPPALATEAAAVATRAVLDRLEAGPTGSPGVRITLQGERSILRWQPHPDCGCRGLSPTERGTGSGAELPVNRSIPMPTTARGVVELA